MHIARKVREMSPPRYTKEEAANLVGISLSTIKRWKETGLFVPLETRTFGKITVDLYTPEDIPVLQDIKKHQKPGRKPSGASSESTEENGPETA